jgi:hypothetical protein
MAKPSQICSRSASACEDGGHFLLGCLRAAIDVAALGGAECVQDAFDHLCAAVWPALLSVKMARRRMADLLTNCSLPFEPLNPHTHSIIERLGHSDPWCCSLMSAHYGALWVPTVHCSGPHTLSSIGTHVARSFHSLPLRRVCLYSLLIYFDHSPQQSSTSRRSRRSQVDWWPDYDSHRISRMQHRWSIWQGGSSRRRVKHAASSILK